MEAQAGLDLGARGLDHSPLVRSALLELPPPTLADNTGPAERLTRGLARTFGLKAVALPLGLAAGLTSTYLHKSA